jgi:hypothetical protein
MTQAEAIIEAIAETKNRFRYPLMENVLEAITDEEIEYALLDSLDEINSMGPQTHFTFLDVWTGADTRWKRILLLGANKNSLLTLLNDWTQRGFDLNIANGEIVQDDRREKINELYGTLVERFDDLLTKLKETSQKFSKGFTSSNNNVLGISSSSLFRRVGPGRIIR